MPGGPPMPPGPMGGLGPRIRGSKPPGGGGGMAAPRGPMVGPPGKGAIFPALYAFVAASITCWAWNEGRGEI